MDKKELRQDPIREKILSALSYIENNRNALYGIVVGVMVIILVGSYLSTTQKEMDRKSSLSFGKAINNSIAGDKDTSVMLFQDLLSEGSKEVAGSALVYLVDYYLSNKNFEKVDSLLNLNIDITDNVLQSKMYAMQGDINLDKKEYEKSLEFYSQAAKINNSIENHMMFKKAVVYYEKEEFKESKKIIEEILAVEDLQYDVKNQCEKYLFILNNSI